MSSLFVQVTVVPTGTVIACGPKIKLSILIATFAVEGWSLAPTRDDPANSSSIAIITGAPKPATRILFLVIFCFLSRFEFFVELLCSDRSFYNLIAILFEIPTAVSHVFVELPGRRFEKDLVKAWFLPILLTESLSYAPRVSVG
jgi:hypothetical protein